MRQTKPPSSDVSTERSPLWQTVASAITDMERGALLRRKRNVSMAAIVAPLCRALVERGFTLDSGQTLASAEVERATRQRERMRGDATLEIILSLVIFFPLFGAAAFNADSRWVSSLFGTVLSENTIPQTLQYTAGVAAFFGGVLLGLAAAQAKLRQRMGKPAASVKETLRVLATLWRLGISAPIAVMQLALPLMTVAVLERAVRGHAAVAASLALFSAALVFVLWAARSMTYDIEASAEQAVSLAGRSLIGATILSPVLLSASLWLLWTL